MVQSKGFLRDTALAGGSALAVSASTFVYYIASARALGVENGGLLLAIVAGTLMLSVPGSIGALVLASAAARIRAAKPPLALAVFVSRCIIGSAIVVIASLVAGDTLAPSIAAYLDAPVVVVIAAAAIFAANVPLLGLRGLIQGIGGISGLVASNAAESVGRIALSCALIFGGASIGVALWGLAIVLYVALGVTVVAVLRRTGWRLAPVKIGTPFAGSTTLVVTMGSLTILSFFDAVAARHYLQPSESGLYNAAALAGRALMTVLAFAPSLIVPRMAHAAESGDDSRTIVRQTLVVATAVCVCASGLFAAFPGLIVHVIAGPRYTDATPLIGLYGLAASSLALATIVASLRAGNDRSALLAWAVASAAAVEIGLILFYHAGAKELVRAVAIGHVIALVATLAATARRLRARENIVGT